MEVFLVLVVVIAVVSVFTINPRVSVWVGLGCVALGFALIWVGPEFAQDPTSIFEPGNGGWMVAVGLGLGLIALGLAALLGALLGFLRARYRQRK